MTITIDYTSEFKRNLRQLSRRYRAIRQDIEPVIEQLKSGETPGNQVGGVGYTVYKVRVKNTDSAKGKSGGYRVIYYLRTEIRTESQITLVTVYSKSDQSDIEHCRLQRILRDYEHD